MMKKVEMVYRIPWIRMMTIIAILCCGNTVLMVQAQNSVSIRANAVVLQNTDIQMITIHDITIDNTGVQEGMVTIAPQTDARAGKILLKGKPNANVRLGYLDKIILSNTTGDGILVCNYEVSGFHSDNQHASQLLNDIERVIRLTENGQYYIWVGGKIDISKTKPGIYEGEFTIEMEYI